jgi:hypothetical protein
MFIQDPGSRFFPSQISAPDPGVTKAQNPGSGFVPVTMEKMCKYNFNKLEWISTTEMLEYFTSKNK